MFHKHVVLGTDKKDSVDKYITVPSKKNVLRESIRESVRESIRESIRESVKEIIKETNNDNQIVINFSGYWIPMKIKMYSYNNIGVL